MLANHSARSPFASKLAPTRSLVDPRPPPFRVLGQERTTAHGCAGWGKTKAHASRHGWQVRRNSFASKLAPTGGFCERGIYCGHDVVCHQFHRATGERGIGPVVSRVDQGAEITNRFPEGQELFNDTADRARND